MRSFEHIYINGRFVTPTGTEWLDIIKPADGSVIGKARLADENDALQAIAAAKAAFADFSRLSVADRLALLANMVEVLQQSEEALHEAIREEYGAPASRSQWMARYPADVVQQVMTELRTYPFVQQAGRATVQMLPLGVAGLITPWNSNAGFICHKLATAIAAGCTTVIKPSEFSIWQTDVVTRALDRAGLPSGVFNIVTGRGASVGHAISTSADVAKISFTGSTETGKAILRSAADSFKRVTLELGGKSPTLILPDADARHAAELAVQAGFINSGQACIAGTRILVPEHRKAEFEHELTAAVQRQRSGPPADAATTIGPMINQRQWERVQRYIDIGVQQGARLLTGGVGRPDALRDGWYVKPTLFSDVSNDMTIARDEIFGPVLCMLTYRDEQEAIAIANDTQYGLSALVIGADENHARQIGEQILAGRVMINTLTHEPRAPFGGFRCSGIGREMGQAGITAFLESRALTVA
ncbi:aldehyde dehydrogenase family protein [Pantoea phytobeneficialis]|uniref:aldehyde dehydrogenase (NAD(+)) n=1 Tax=Pantoea phytobeneficialis TaxID=2052056 RepID=A0AAP9KP99_9GAMM|nr:aldehyde dehydrogenase family protein [Pantoea phytobeneficialis]MDO6405671.1 aldehyde dehydrogenase family protein [Pantoea phytobeneficialis]QGR06689.1 aldehyde dehydrogenase family protein [Pantoea phytobeneficialis]